MKGDIVTFYVVGRDWPDDETTPIRIHTGKARVVPSGYRVVEGRQLYDYRTNLRHDEVDLTVADALTRAQNRNNDDIRTTQAELTLALKTKNELDTLARELRGKNKK